MQRNIKIAGELKKFGLEERLQAVTKTREQRLASYLVEDPDGRVQDIIRTLDAQARFIDDAAVKQMLEAVKSFLVQTLASCAKPSTSGGDDTFFVFKDGVVTRAAKALRIAAGRCALNHACRARRLCCWRTSMRPVSL